MSHSSSSARNTAYYLHIQNLPDEYTWQDLKDLIRNCAWHGVWAEKAVDANGFTSGTGFARVQRKEEAEDLYRYLTENQIMGRHLIVHLWDISSSPPVLKDSNGGRADERVVRRQVYTSGWQTTNPPGASSALPVAQGYHVPGQLQYPVSPMPLRQPPPVTALPQSMQALQIQGQVWAYPLQTPYVHSNLQIAQQPSYGAVMASPRAPVNVAQGYARTESRGVFVSGLDFAATRADIERHFSRVGQIESISLKGDAKRNSKGYATIQYASADAAQRAIDKFNGKEWMKRKLTVRSDRNQPFVEPPRAGPSTHPMNRNSTPIIVNGSEI